MLNRCCTPPAVLEQLYVVRLSFLNLAARKILHVPVDREVAHDRGRMLADVETITRARHLGNSEAEVTAVLRL